MKKILILTIVSLLTGPLATFGQQAAPVAEKEFASELDAYIQSMMQAIPELPSVAMVVVKDDKPIYMRAVGVANKEIGTKADVNTLYYNGSSTKSYMALAAALLDREGKIKLDEPFTKYAKGVTFKTPIPDKITVRNLLTHTSGLRNSALTWRTAFSGEHNDNDLVRVLAGGTTLNEQNYGKYLYTNLGYNIYGILIKQTLGKSWQQVLQDKVFRPLKLKQTVAAASKARSAGLTLADGYLFDPAAGSVIFSPILKRDNNMQAAGGMYSSLGDLARWLRVNINNGTLDGKQVIPADVMQLVHTGYTDNVREEGPFTGNSKYGLGWQIGKYRTENVISHHGGYSGWSSHISYMPDKKIGVAVMINESTAGGRAGHMLATYAYDRLLGTDTAESYAKQLQAIVERYGQMKQQMIGGVRSRASRTSQLTKPLDQYIGRYTNDLLGTFDIAIRQNALAVQNGYIHVVSTPYTEKDSIRVEMIPGEGEIIKFTTGPDGKVDSLTYGGMKFVRSPR